MPIIKIKVEAGPKIPRKIAELIGIVPKKKPVIKIVNPTNIALRKAKFDLFNSIINSCSRPHKLLVKLLLHQLLLL